MDLTRKSIPSMGNVTEYRNLKLLRQGKEVESVIFPGENPRYKMAALDHHHFKCTACDVRFL
ncbi:MAG: transcriptional repressor [Gammaproteobacteria bacterium]|nr:transcriptional repressor [Gammaproteobacteria bacterium]